MDQFYVEQRLIRFNFILENRSDFDGNVNFAQKPKNTNLGPKIGTYGFREWIRIRIFIPSWKINFSSIFGNIFTLASKVTPIPPSVLEWSNFPHILRSCQFSALPGPSKDVLHHFPDPVEAYYLITCPRVKDGSEENNHIDIHAE